MICLYDWLLELPERRCLTAWRSELMAHAQGRVLEVGAGTGANVRHYPDDTDLTLIEPDKRMRARLEEKGFSASRAFAEQLPFEDASFDTVACTLVLCSVRSVEDAIAEFHRVLKPGGRLLFMEHVRSESARVARWQTHIEPVWSFFAAGCHLTRQPLTVMEGRFELSTLQRGRMRPAPRIAQETVRGVAVRV